MTGLQMVSAKLHGWTDACLQAEHCLFLCPGVVLQRFCVCACACVTFTLLTSQVPGSRFFVCVVTHNVNNADTEARSRHLACKQHEDAVHEVHVPICCLTKPVTTTVTDHVPEGITKSYVIMT